MNTPLQDIQEIFGRHPRPEHFTDFHHCCECAEHNQELAEESVESIGLKTIGNAGWDPIAFATREAYLYYFPALARLAEGQGKEYYLDQFVMHLGSRRSEYFTLPEQQAVIRFLHHLEELFRDEEMAASDLIDLRLVRGRIEDEAIAKELGMEMT